MTVLHVEPTEGDYPTIQAATTASSSGDTIQVHPAVYAENVRIPQRTDLSFLAEPGAILDGGGTLGTAFYAFNASTIGITVDGFEIRNYRNRGVQLAGGVKYARTRHKVSNNHIHHIIGPAANSYGMWLSGGNPTVTGNTIHDVGWLGESTGIWTGYCHDHLIDSNQLWACRKEGIRDYYGLRATITNNRSFRHGFAGIATNMSISPLVANNIMGFAHAGLNPKHVNSATDGAFNYWNLEDPALIEWARYWHNTIYRCTMAGVLLDGGAMTKLDIRNNIFAGRGGVAFNGNCLDPKIVDHNVYDTSDPSKFLFDMPYVTFGSQQKTLQQVRAERGWELNGAQLDAGLVDPLHGNFDPTSVGPGADLESEWGSQVGARGLPSPRVHWTPIDKKVVNAKSKGYAPGYSGHLNTNDERAQTYLLTGKPPGTNGAVDEWIIYDLGESQTFNGIHLTVYDHARPTNVKRFTFETSDDQVSWTQVLDFGETGTDSNMSGFPAALPEPVTCRYVRFTAKTCFGAAYMVISDVQVGMLVSQSERRLGIQRFADRPERRIVGRRRTDV